VARRRHPTRHTPHRAIVVYTLLVALLALTGTFIRLLVLANIVGLLLYAQCTVAAWLVRRRDVRGDGEPFVAPGGAWVPWLACAAIAWVIAETATRVEAIGAALLLLVASAAYAARAWSRRR
jgi:APA family basic amino acid/polyamine antiporter